MSLARERYPATTGTTGTMGGCEKGEYLSYLYRYGSNGSREYPSRPYARERGVNNEYRD